MIPENYECEGQMEFEWNVPDIDVGNKYSEDRFHLYMNPQEGEKENDI